MMSAKFVAAGFVATAAFISLAVVGWGGPVAYFAHPALIVLTLLTFVLMLASVFTAANLDSGQREDRSNRWVLVAFGILGIVSAWLPAFTDKHDILTIGGEPSRWIGVVIYTIGGVLRLWPVFVLGRRFSGLVAIQRDHRLVTTGIYSIIRHPSYLGMLIILLGWAIVFRSVLGLILALLTIIPVIARIRAEEKMLASQFGEGYAAYRGRTWRLVPLVY